MWSLIARGLLVSVLPLCTMSACNEFDPDRDCGPEERHHSETVIPTEEQYLDAGGLEEGGIDEEGCQELCLLTLQVEPETVLEWNECRYEGVSDTPAGRFIFCDLREHLGCTL